jgi:hypothetical protein
MNSDQVLVKKLCNENKFDDAVHKWCPRKYRSAISRLWASKLLRYPVTLKTPLSHLQKGSKTSYDEVQQVDIFPQPWHHLLTAQFGRSENSLCGCPENNDQWFDVNHWNKLMEVLVEKNCVTWFMKISQVKLKSCWNFGKKKKRIRFRFFLILSSYFSLNRRQKFSFSFLTRDQQVLIKWYYFLAFYSSINLII